MGKMKKMVDEAGGFDDKEIKRQEAIISSMTKEERRKPALMNAKRKIRVASGSGTSVQDVNKLLKAHRQMADMMKKMGKGGMKGLAQQMMGGLPGMGGGLPGMGKADLAALGAPKKAGADEVVFEALERAMKGLGPMPPSAGGFPGFGKK
jgi:signal recognition particle subunit SRP54